MTVYCVYPCSEKQMKKNERLCTVCFPNSSSNLLDCVSHELDFLKLIIREDYFPVYWLSLGWVSFKTYSHSGRIVINISKWKCTRKSTADPLTQCQKAHICFVTLRKSVKVLDPQNNLKPSTCLETVRFAHSSRKLSTSSGKSHEPSRRNTMRRSNMLIFVTTDKKLTLQGFNFPLTFCYSDNANYQSRLVLRVRSMSFLLHRALYFYSLLTMSHCLYCSEPPPQGWSVGPDRYYTSTQPL